MSYKIPNPPNQKEISKHPERQFKKKSLPLFGTGIAMLKT